MRHYGYLPRDFPCLAALVDEADRKLFRSISHNPTHVLHHYFIDKPGSCHTLRTRAHNFVLPIKDDKNFCLAFYLCDTKNPPVRTTVTLLSPRQCPWIFLN